MPFPRKRKIIQDTEKCTNEKIKKYKGCPHNNKDHEKILDQEETISNGIENDEDNNSTNWSDSEADLKAENLISELENQTWKDDNSDFGSDESMIEDVECTDFDNMDLSELEELLDEALPNKYKKPLKCNTVNKNEKLCYIKKDIDDFEEYNKNLLQDIRGDHFDLLPDDWIRVTNNSGMPLYLARKTRVCTLGRPYFLGSGNLYNHRIPISAIPCLQYKKMMEKNINVSKICVENYTREIRNLRVPITKIETVSENQLAQSLSADEVKKYCEKVFKFRKVYVKKKLNANNNVHLSENGNPNFKNRPSLPAGTKLLSFSTFDRDANNEIIKRREWVMNPSGKSYIAILHEYLQQSLKIQPEYEVNSINETEFECVVKLQDEVYGHGAGNCKKDAKMLAAKQTIEILIPELNGKAEEICGSDSTSNVSTDSTRDSNNIFDEISIIDPRVTEFCSRTTEPTPYPMLITCLKRNWGAADIDVQYTVNTKHNKYNSYMMTVGVHSTTVECRNKRDGKQKAAQSILQALHPQLTTWGSLVRLYGNHSIKNSKEKKREEHEITKLQTYAQFNQPNYAILNKLSSELQKLLDKKNSVKPMGQLITSDKPTVHSGNLNPLNFS